MSTLPLSSLLSVFACFSTLLSFLLASPATVFGAQVDNQTELISFYENACGAELAKMRAAWDALGMHGVCETCFYESVSGMDEAALEQQVRDNAGEGNFTLGRRSGTAEYDRTNEWDDCLLRTRAGQLGVVLADLEPQAPGSDEAGSTAPPNGDADSGGEVPADDAGEETGSATDPAGEETGGATDPSALAGTPSDGTTPDGQPAPGAVQPAMTSEGLDALVTSCASLRQATLQAGGLAPVHSPEADFSSCVKTRAEIPPNGGLFNECGVEVEVAYCLYRPYAGTHGTVVDCERGRYQVLRLPPNEGRSAFVTDAELVYTPACRVPGFSIVQNDPYAPFVPGYGLQMSCRAWPGTEDPAAREGLFGGDCSNDHFVRMSGLSIPPPVPAAAPTPEVWQPPEFSETPSESYDDSYDSRDSYDDSYGSRDFDDSYEDQGYSEPDTGQAITDAALQLMEIYMQQQGMQSSGTGGYDSNEGNSRCCTATREICEELIPGYTGAGCN